MKIAQLLEAPILGRGMSKAARAADVEQSDREYIAQRQQRDKWKKAKLKGCKCPGPYDHQVSNKCPIHGVVSESTKVLDLQMMVDMLNKDKTIDEADLLKDGIEVQTRKGDLVTFHLNGGKLYAWVQGQKRDIDCGDIGDSVADIKTFLKGINKAWYREHDDDFDD